MAIGDDDDGNMKLMMNKWRNERSNDNDDDEYYE